MGPPEGLIRHWLLISLYSCNVLFYFDTAQIGYEPTSDINETRLVICTLIESYPQKMDNHIKAEAHDVMLVNRTGVG